MAPSTCFHCKRYDNGRGDIGCKGCVLAPWHPSTIAKLVDLFGSLDVLRTSASAVSVDDRTNWFMYRYAEAEALIADRVGGAGKLIEYQDRQIADLKRQVDQLSKEKAYLVSACKVVRLQGQKAFDVLRSQGIDPFEMILRSEVVDVEVLKKVQTEVGGDVNALQTEVAGDVNTATGKGAQGQVVDVAVET